MMVPSIVLPSDYHCICGFPFSAHCYIPFLILNALEISSSLPTQAQVSKSTVILSIDGCHMVMATNISIDRIT